MPMTAEQFEAALRAPHRTRKDAEDMLAKAKAAKNHEFVAIADQVMTERWGTAQTLGSGRGGGSIPTSVQFKGQIRHFDSSKAAYLHLLDQFRIANPDPFELRATMRSSLFAKNQASWPDIGKIGGGWIANTGINNRVKFDNLLDLGGACRLHYQEDWDFDTERKSISLAERQASIDLANSLLDELLRPG
jgi:hypothetical protein